MKTNHFLLFFVQKTG